MLTLLNGASAPGITDISAGVYDGFTTRGGTDVQPRYSLLLTFDDPIERLKYKFAHGTRILESVYGIANMVRLSLMPTRGNYRARGFNGAQVVSTYDWGVDTVTGLRKDMQPNVALWGTLQVYLGVTNLQTVIGHNEIRIHNSVLAPNGCLHLDIEVVPHVNKTVQRSYGSATAQINESAEELFDFQPSSSGSAQAGAQPVSAPIAQPIPVAVPQGQPATAAPMVPSYPVAATKPFSISRAMTAEQQLNLVELCNAAGKPFEFVD